MTVLPEPPADIQAGQTSNPLTDAVVQAAIENVLHEARRTGTAPPAGRPERPAMSEAAVDSSVRMIAFGGMTLMISAGGGIIMIASDFANPTVIGMICAAPIPLGLLLLAAGRLARRVGEAAPTETHHHYNGPVTQQQHTDQRRAVWQKDVNGKPRR